MSDQQDFPGFVADNYLRYLDSCEQVPEPLASLTDDKAVIRQFVSTVLQDAAEVARKALREMSPEGFRHTPSGTGYNYLPSEDYPEGCLLLMVRPVDSAPAPSLAAVTAPITREPKASDKTRAATPSSVRSIM